MSWHTNLNIIRLCTRSSITVLPPERRNKKLSQRRVRHGISCNSRETVTRGNRKQCNQGIKKKKMASLQLHYISYQTSADSIHWNVGFNAFACFRFCIVNTDSNWTNLSFFARVLWSYRWWLLVAEHLKISDVQEQLHQLRHAETPSIFEKHLR